MSWASFKPFPRKLNLSILQVRLDSQSKPDYKTVILYFAQWIHGLRQSPENYSIPNSSIQDVLNVLNVFFPEPAQNKYIEPVRVRTDPVFPDSQVRIIPVSVNFGPAKGTILISDAPNALAYIFSIATPSVSAPTVDNYYLPLTICYTWFLCLAFLSPISSPALVLTNVPSEACVLYLPSSVESSLLSPVFCLGATWSGADATDAFGAGMLYTIESTLDAWRSDQYTGPSFARNPSAKVPMWTPRLRILAARRLNEYILGKNGNDSTTTPFLDSLFSGVVPEGDLVGLPEYIETLTAAVIIDAKQPGISVTPNFLISHSELSPKLMDLLLAIFDASGNVSDTVGLLLAFSALIEFHITPHVAATGTSKAVVTGLASTLPALLLSSLLKKLQSLQAHLQHSYESTDDKIRYIQSLYWIMDDKPYGRGSEAFPICVLSSKTFGDALLNTKLSTIQGFKLQVRALGQAIAGGAFETELSSANLDNATFQTIESQPLSNPIACPPDAESQVLLQQAQTRVDGWLPGYNSDAKRMCPKIFALFSA